MNEFQESNELSRESVKELMRLDDDPNLGIKKFFFFSNLVELKKFKSKSKFKTFHFTK